MPLRTPGRAVLVLLVLWALASAASATLVQRGQQHSRAALEERFALRADLAASFADGYLRDIATAERRAGVRHLGGRRPSLADTVRVADLLGFPAAVLLDRRGRALHVVPAKRELVGAPLARRYRHLRSAVRGEVAVSNVVRSAARGDPVVAVAVPFAAAGGRRVLSGAFDVRDSPLGSYLRNASSIAESRLYFVDARGVVVASSDPARAAGQPFAASEPVIARALAGGARGRAGGLFYAARAVPRTPWRTVTAVPESELYRPLDTFGRWSAWVAWAAFALVALLGVLLARRLLVQRAALARANAELARLASRDPLTGLYNRRHLEEGVAGELARARRTGEPVALLIADVDRFKAINDELGHAAGDAVLAQVAKSWAEALRGHDLVGRWGGDELVAVLPGTDAAGAAAAGERARALVASRPLAAGGRSLTPTLSIGVAEWGGESAEVLFAEADVALYAAKASGRDRVLVAAAPAP